MRATTISSATVFNPPSGMITSAYAMSEVRATSKMTKNSSFLSASMIRLVPRVLAIAWLPGAMIVRMGYFSPPRTLSHLGRRRVWSKLDTSGPKIPIYIQT